MRQTAKKIEIKNKNGSTCESCQVQIEAQPRATSDRRRRSHQHAQCAPIR